MTESEVKIEECRDGLDRQHYQIRGSWRGIDVDRMARFFDLKVSKVVEVMGQIERHYDRQKQESNRKWQNIKYTKPCRTCGVVIGFAETEAGELMPVNLSDFSTHWACEKPGKGKRK